MVQWGIALVALLIGACGALIYGFWGVAQDCHTWVNSHGYQLEHFDWCAKTGGCVAKNTRRRRGRPQHLPRRQSEGLGVAIRNLRARHIARLRA
jgi:hypothetical protein